MNNVLNKCLTSWLESLFKADVSIEEDVPVDVTEKAMPYNMRHVAEVHAGMSSKSALDAMKSLQGLRATSLVHRRVRLVDGKVKQYSCFEIESTHGGVASFIKYVAHGGNGTVCLHRSEHASSFFLYAIKTVMAEQGVENEETQGYNVYVSLMQRKSPALRFLVPVLKLSAGDDTATPTCYGMPAAVGTLCVLLPNGTPVERIAQVLRVVNGCLGVLWREGVAYMDLKPENVLVMGGGNSKFTVLLGDVGSLCFDGDSSMCTYPPPTHPSGVGVPATSKNVLYGLGMLMWVLLWGHDHRLQFLSFAHLEDGQHKKKCMIHAALQRISAVAETSPQLSNFLWYCMVGGEGNFKAADALLRLVMAEDRGISQPPREPHTQDAHAINIPDELCNE